MWKTKIDSSQNLEELEKIRVELFGKKGYFPAQFIKLKTIPNEEKRDFANNLNSESVKII